MKVILCVEDERRVLENNRKALTDSGYTVMTAETLVEARERLAGQMPDAIVLDIMLPDGLGLDLLKELRERGNTIPVLLLTAWDKPSDVARGLRMGANDYLSKPFEYEELLARVETMFRNTEQVPETVTRGRFTFKPAPMIALLDGVDILLTQKEFSLLMLFTQNEDKTMSAEYIYEKVWGREMVGDDRAVKQQISNLREKIKESGYVVTTVWGEGYRFELKP